MPQMVAVRRAQGRWRPTTMTAGGSRRTAGDMKTSYILISPVHNEEAHLDALIDSVVNQTVLPRKWVLVNDASTDDTARIIAQHEAKHEFIKLLHLPRDGEEAYYSRKTVVFLAGYEHIRDRCDYDFIGNLDADIILPPTYYEGILNEFDRNPHLGIAGGTYVYGSENRREKVLFDELSVPGSAQVSRRECYEQVGGYIPLRYGGEDTLTQITARMHGWQTKAFPAHAVLQQRAVGTAETGSVLRARFRQGLSDYGVATHPLFMLAKLLRRAFREKPYVSGSFARFFGYTYGCLLGEQRKLSRDVMTFVRREQLRRLTSCFHSRHVRQDG